MFHSVATNAVMESFTLENESERERERDRERDGESETQR